MCPKRHNNDRFTESGEEPPTNGELALVATTTPTLLMPTLAETPTLFVPTASVEPSLPTATLPPSSSISTTADLLLSAKPADYCGPFPPERGCGKPLAVLIADHLQRHPDDPQALALWRRVISLGKSTTELGAADPQSINVGWAFDDRAQAEFMALNLSPDPVSAPSAPFDFGELTIIPTNVDGDETEDYLLNATISGEYTPLGQLRLMRWRDGGWTGEHLLSYDNDGGHVNVSDASGRCGSACSGQLAGWTWRNGERQSLFPPWADHGSIRVQTEQGALVVSSSDVRYRFDGEFLTPAELVVPTGRFSDRIGSQLAYAHGLIVLGRFDEAIDQLEKAAAQSDGSFGFGHNDLIKDARPTALFRIGAIHLLNNDPAAARTAWERTAQTYPKSLAAAVVLDLNLANFNGSMSQWCEIIAANQVLITDSFQRGYLDQFPTNEFDWLPLCHPRLRLPLHQWTKIAPLADQFAALGLPWQPLSNDYDLNDDGINDPLGVVDWLGIYTPWAFLSTGDRYQPLYVMQPWSSATPLTSLTDIDYLLRRPTAVRITDLDADGAPELSFDSGGYLYFTIWRGDRFWADHISLYQESQRFTATLSLAPQPDGTSQFIVDLLPNADGVQPDPNHLEYRLRDGRLQQTVPAPTDPISEYTYGLNPAPLDEVYVALFGQNDPGQALRLLTTITPPNQTRYTHEQLVLQALALDYSGQSAEAQRLLQTIAEANPPSGWSLFARTKK